MSERVLTTFYPQINKTKITTNTKLLSKSNISEKINKSKQDYFFILSQIKSKKKHIEDSSLYQNYLFNNNKRKHHFLKYNLLNQKSRTQIALITEPFIEKKNLSGKKFQKNILFSERSNSNLNKTKLFLRQNLGTPKKPINRIIKFEEEKSTVRKIKLSKRRKPIELSKDYKDYIKKINKSNFIDHINSKTEYGHNIRSSFLISKVNESLQLEKKRNDKYQKIEKEKIESEKELRDKVPYPSMDFLQLSKKIREILGKENKFSQIENREHFFDYFPNRVNFIYDNFKPPSIKNNLTKIKFEDMYNDKNLNLINRIGNYAINYISNKKVKIQREKDEKNIFMKEKDKITKKYLYYKKLTDEHIYNSKEEIEKIIYKNYYSKQDDDFSKPENDVLALDDNFEKRNYFENKFEKFEKVCIAEPKLRKFLFDNLNAKIKKSNL